MPNGAESSQRNRDSKGIVTSPSFFTTSPEETEAWALGQFDGCLSLGGEASQ